MQEHEFEALKIQASITPQKNNWPEPKVEASILGDKPTLTGDLHWDALHSCVDDARNRTMKAFGAMAAIDADKSLSREGKDLKKAEIANAAIASFSTAKAIVKARAAVDRVTQQLATKVAAAIKPAADIHEATVHAQVRDRVAAMKGGAKMAWLAKHASDPVVASAILTAPSCLSDLTDAELALFRRKAEQQTIGPEIVEARDATVKALQDTEAGLRNAVAQIQRAGGLKKGPDGTWSQPTTSAMS
jgi:hypothetical protein